MNPLLNHYEKRVLHFHFFNFILLAQNDVAQTIKHQTKTAKEKEATLTTGELSAGMYIYSLVVDGQVLATKKMIILK
ncbi:MAG: hypothetical protein LPK21_12625 [Hymenobacteraceae bacterium]|nr:hypothetical protein [Hymenobacteraceae bacterium]